MDEPFGVDPGDARAPTRNWPASSETITVSGSKNLDGGVAPHSATSLAMSTGSGVTFIALRPNACK